MTQIVIATPAHGQVFFTPYLKSLLNLQRLIDRKGWSSIFCSIAYAEIAESRNYLLTHWFDRTKASHILFVDTDMGFEPKLVADMVAFDKPIVGVVAPRRQINLMRLAELSSRGEQSERAVARAHDFVYRKLKQQGPPRVVQGFIEVDACGAGILLIQRNCIATMLKKMPQINDINAKKTSPLAKNLSRLIRAFDILSNDTGRLSEDYSFCHRWRQGCGGQIWANVTHKIVHIGLHPFSGRYVDVMPRGPSVKISTGALTRRGTAGNGKTSAEGIPPKIISGRLTVPGKAKPGGK